MKAQHPIDDLFRRPLEDRQVETPMHLWAGIAQKVTVPPKKGRRKYLLALTAIALCAASLLPSDVASKKGKKDAGHLPASSERPVAGLNTAPPSQTTTVTLPGPTSPKSAQASRTATRTRRPVYDGQASLPPAIKKARVTPLDPTDTPTETIEDVVSNDAAPVRDAFDPFAALPSLTPSLEPLPVQDFLPGFRFLGERWFASFDLSFSNDWKQRSLSAASPDYQGYADLRNASEQFLSAHSAALRLSLISASGITLKSGIQVSTYTESFLQSRTELVAVPNPIRNANGQVVGMDTLFQNRSYQWTTKNRFHTIDIPLLVGYEFALGRLNVGLNGGALLNMAFNQQGTFLGPDGKTVLDFSSNRPDSYPAFKNRLGVGWYGSTQLSFPISPSLRVLAEPYFSIFPRSYTNADYPVAQRYHTMGLFIGVRKLLGPYWLNLKP